MTRRHIVITLLLLGVIGGGLLFSKLTPHSLCQNLRCIRMQGRDAFRLKELYTDSQDAYRALFDADHTLLRIEAIPVTPAVSRQELDASIARMRALFEKAPAPYPGDISDAVVCDPRFIPTYEEIPTDGVPLALFVGYLNNRMTFGSCSPDQAVYRGILVLTYCPTQSLLLRTELIATVSDFLSREKELMDQIKTLRCRE